MSGCSVQMSSMAPSAHMSAAPSITPQNPCWFPSAAAGMTIAAKMAIPPSRGIGSRCSRRSSSGRSSRPARQAASETAGVSSSTSMKATAKPDGGGLVIEDRSGHGSGASPERVTRRPAGRSPPQPGTGPATAGVHDAGTVASHTAVTSSIVQRLAGVRSNDGARTVYRPPGAHYHVGVRGNDRGAGVPERRGPRTVSQHARRRRRPVRLALLRVLPDGRTTTTWPDDARPNSAPGWAG